MIVDVLRKRLAQMLVRIDRSLAQLGRRCCVVRSQRRLDRAQLPAR
jgi:hypothetical protein